MQEQFIGYLKFNGPKVDNGEININKVGYSLIALNKTFVKFCKIQKIDTKAELKLKNIKKGSTEIQIIIEQLMPAVKPISTASAFAIFANSIGISELGKQFFGTIGEQLGLKIFSKGKKITEGKPQVVKNNIVINLINTNNETKQIPLKNWKLFKEMSNETSGILQLEQNQKLSIGYIDNNKNTELITIDYNKEYTNTTNSNIEIENEDPFDESKAEEVKLIGKFIDYYGFAHKYSFAFQVRKKQNLYGKQKILCIVKQEHISSILELLKPENSKDIIIKGLCTRDFEDKIDKIKIEWISEDFNYDPNQISI